MLSCEYCEIFKNSFFHRPPPVAASTKCSKGSFSAKSRSETFSSTFPIYVREEIAVLGVSRKSLVQMLNKTGTKIKTLFTHHMKNIFYFLFKALFVLKIFPFLLWLFVYVEKWLDKKTRIIFKFYDVTDWTTNN